MGRARTWTIASALRDLVEILIILAFVIVVPGLVEKAMVTGGLAVGGLDRILATGMIFIVWALIAVALTKLNREPLAEIGLKLPAKIGPSMGIGLVVAAVIFAAVVMLESGGFGKDRLGDMAAELKGHPDILLARIVISVLVVGVVEELMFRGFLMTRLAKLFGDRGASWFLALFVQAALFGIAHAYQHLYGVLLTAAIGLFLGVVYLASGRSLLPVVIAHGVYDAAHAYYISIFQ